MKSKRWKTFAGALFCALLLAITPAAFGGTILKLNLGNVSPDLGMTAGGILGTVSDGDAGTTGDQNTAIEYTDFLDGLFADIGTPIASYTMSDLAVAGPAQVFGSLVVQGYAGGSFHLYDPSNALLLSGMLTNSVLTGVMGPPGTGSIFTTSVSTVTGGSLQTYIVPNSLSLTFNLTDVNGGAGFSVGGGGPVLNPFLTDAAVNITGEPGPGVPEPATLMLVLAGVAAGAAFGRRQVR
jgi:PEP-CTERM motif